MEKLFNINKVSELKWIMEQVSNISLYGAGFYLDMFLNEIQTIDSRLINKISRIIVTNKQGNETIIQGIGVVEWKIDLIKPGDIVFLTLGNRFIREVYETLKKTGAKVYQLDFNMFQREPYSNIQKAIQPFIDRFPENITKLNLPDEKSDNKIGWVFWWQGLDEAPELVRVCIESQKRNLPVGFRQIIITKDNYKKYISLPNGIISKVENGYITLITLSDIFRMSLLYQYGGFWMDATLLVLKPLPNDIESFSVYTRNLPGTQCCTEVMWADWFLYAHKGHTLFQFVMEAFFYYYSVYDKIKYYYTIDYFIAIACNTYEDVENDMKKIPNNNENALELAKHLTEPFDKNSYDKYVRDCYVQKLTYKIDWRNKVQEDSIYNYIIRGEKK